MQIRVNAHLQIPVSDVMQQRAPALETAPLVRRYKCFHCPVAGVIPWNPVFRTGEYQSR